MEEDIKILEEKNDALFELSHERFEEIAKLQAKINALQMVHDYDVKMIDEVKGEAVKLYKEIEKLKRQIKIKNNYLQLIHDIGFDYDGMDTKKGLKSVIDDLVDLAVKAIKNDDKYAMYQGGNDKYFNILYEEVEKENE